jgi:YfiH family protein
MSSSTADASSGGLFCDLPGDGHALFTARAHGNMSSVGGLDHEHGSDARERLRTRLGLRRLARGYQVHGTTVLPADLRSVGADADMTSPDPAAIAARPPVEADGHATSLARIGVMVLAADCLPVALGSPHAVAMLHAGWRGLAAGVLEEGVRALRELDGDGEIVAIIGPGAGPCCYEVGPEVHAAFASGGTTAVSDMTATTAAAAAAAAAAGHGGSPIDLKSIARERLLGAGVGRVHDTGLCTICDPRFFSHRRESTDAGRQAGVAWLT